GSRQLRRWLNRPLRHRATLEARQQAVLALLQDGCYQDLRRALKPIGDMERILARVALRSARPRDLARLAVSLGAFPDIQQACAAVGASRIAALAASCGTFPQLEDLLQRALIDNPPMVIRDGGVIAPGFDAEL